MEYTNSSLIDSTVLSPNYSNDRITIDRITPHHTATDPITGEQIGNIFSTTKRGASCSYGLGNEGSCCLIVPEKYRPWTSSSPANDKRAITFEISNSKYGEPWAISDKAYEKFVLVAADICQRYGKTEVFNIVDEIASVPQAQRAAFANNYVVPDGKILLTQHNYFCSTACPGTYLKNHFKSLTDDINKAIGGIEPTLTPTVAVALPTLRQGNHNEQVRVLQHNLMAVGIRLPNYGADGWYGAETKNGVVELQRRVFPEQPKEWDGVYGNKTYNKLKALLQ